MTTTGVAPTVERLLSLAGPARLNLGRTLTVEEKDQPNGTHTIESFETNLDGREWASASRTSRRGTSFSGEEQGGGLEAGLPSLGASCQHGKLKMIMH